MGPLHLERCFTQGRTTYNKPLKDRASCAVTTIVRRIRPRRTKVRRVGVEHSLRRIATSTLPGCWSTCSASASSRLHAAGKPATTRHPSGVAFFVLDLTHDQAGQRPHRGDETNEDKDNTPAERSPLQILIVVRLIGRTHQRGKIADHHRAANRQHQKRQQILAQEHKGHVASDRGPKPNGAERLVPTRALQKPPFRTDTNSGRRIRPRQPQRDRWGLNTPSNTSPPALFQGAGALVRPPPPLARHATHKLRTTRHPYWGGVLR
jgi:hypothetical protein